MSEVPRLVVIGTGLIGGSVAAAARAAGFAERVIGLDADPSALEAGVAAGLLDATGLPEDLGPDDLVVLAVPTLAVPDALAELVDEAGVLAGGAVVTDTASVKGSVVAALRSLPREARGRFVPGHPIAGSERSGVGAASPDLFRDHRVLLTPEPDTAPEALARVEALWRAAGAEVLRMDVAEHDRILAMTSHLPHLLAFALVDTLGAQREHEEIFRHAAGGFRDFTRIASSDPVMWRDVFAANGPAVLSILDRFVADLGRLRDRLAADDRAALHETFTRAKALRDAHVGTGTHRG